MEKEYCVYCHIAPNEKQYIGITCQKPNDRWCGGKGYEHNTHFSRAIKKYGWDAFKHIILFSGLSKEDASRLEKKLIREYNTQNQNKGYNIEPGGFGGGHPTSDETKLKISKANKGKPCPEHQKKYLSKLNKGKIPTNLKAVHAKNQKPVDQLDINGNYITSFPSIRIAGKKCKVSENGIGLCCRGVNKTCGGYMWRFSV